MSFIITKKTFELATEGLHSAHISEVIDLGLCKTVYGEKDRFQIHFLMDDQNGENGSPIEVRMKPMTKSIHRESSFAKFLTALRIPVGGQFDAESLIGLELKVCIIHATVDGVTYANVATLLPTKKVESEI